VDSRERVHRAVRREGPDRPARDLWLLPATRPALGPGLDALLERWPRDISTCGVAQWPGEEAKVRRGRHVDPWGSVWVNELEGLLGMVTGHPLADDSAIDAWRPPFDVIASATENLPRIIERQAGDKFRLGGSLELFHRMCWLRPMEKILTDMLLAPERFDRLLRGVAGFFDRMLERLLGLDIDAVLIVDDWGSQRQMFISPEDWRRHFKPHCARWAAECRRAGKLCFMHSDGHILPIIADLEEIGIDALNCEIDCMGIETVAERRGRICLWGEVDRQHLLPRGTPDEVSAAACRFLQTIHRPEGGYILQSEIGPDVPLANVEALLREWGLKEAPAT
jgi:uroporphyrinogen decarboxylase